MDGYEATKIVFQRIQSLDPENASKIMGVLFIQEHGEKDMIRLAFGPESLVHSVILKAKKELLGLSSSSSSPSTPSSPFGSLCFSRQNSSSSSGRLLSGLNPKYSSSFENGVGHFPSDSSSMNSSAPPCYGSGGSEVDLIDEFQLQDQLSFLNDGCSPKDQDLDSILHNHRRSYSVSDVCFGADQEYANGGFGWKPCLYYAKGYCKNGSNCRFVHGEDVINGVETTSMVGSPSKFEMMEQCQQQVLLRSKSVQHQRLAAASQLNFLLQPQHLQAAESPRAAAAAALMMADEMHNFSRTRFERGDFGLNGGIANPGSRQIYLTFPADSTFKEEDVSNYFSTYGPVQDVRIPYQQKRMFGFVTFVYSETVKAILAKGNPHFVCDARVLVKPYKEKGKVPEKFRKQHMERGEFTGCGSPTGLETRDPCDLQLGGRMFHSTQDMLLRRKLEEQVDLQQAIELHSRRLMNLQLLDVKRSNHHRTLSLGAVIPSPTAHSPGFFNQSSVLWADHNSQEAAEENGFAPNVAENGRESFSVREEFSNGKGSAMKEEIDFQLRFTSGHGTIGM